MLTNYFAFSFPFNQHPDKDIYTMSSTDSTSITTGKIKINGKQVWHLFARSMIYCFQHWKTVLILSLLLAFINNAGITIYFYAIGFFVQGLTELLQSLEPRESASILGYMLAIFKTGNLALLAQFVAVTFIYMSFIGTIFYIAWYRYILASGDKNILRSVFRWSNKHTRFFLWQLVVQFIMILALTSLFLGFTGAYKMASALPFADKAANSFAIILVILLFFMLFLWALGVLMRASLIFPCLVISPEVSIKQIFNKTTSNFNTFCLLIPLQVILVFLVASILAFLLAQLTYVLLDISLNENITSTSWYSDVSLFLTAFLTEFIFTSILVGFIGFWLATFFMFIASHFFPAQFKSLSSK